MKWYNVLKNIIYASILPIFIIGCNNGSQSNPAIPGKITVAISAESVNVGDKVTLTYTLVGAKNLSANLLITANSSNKAVISEDTTTNQCSLNSTTSTCTITQSGLSTGSAIIMSTAKGLSANSTYNIENVTIAVKQDPVLGTIKVSTPNTTNQAFIGNQLTLTYTLESSQFVTTPISIVALSSNVSVLNSSAPSCQVTTESPTCTITESGLSAGTAIISSDATGYTINSLDIFVTRWLTRLTGITINGNHAYTLSSDGLGYILKCDVESNGSLSNCSNSGAKGKWDNIQNIAINNNYAYITSYGNDTVTICAIESNGNLQNCNDYNHDNTLGFNTLWKMPYAIAINNNYAYITSTDYDATAGFVVSCAINSDGTFGNCFNSNATVGKTPTGLTINGNYAYVVSYSNHTISLCTLAESGSLGSNCQDSGAIGLNSPIGIVVSGTNAYITNNASNLVTHCSVGVNGMLSNCQDSGATTLTNPTAITINNSYAYITNFEYNNSSVTICSIQKNGLLNACQQVLN